MAKAAPIKNATANKHIAIQANGGRHASSGRFACLTKLKKFPTMKDRRSTRPLNGEQHGTVSPPVALAMAEGALDMSSADVAVSVTGTPLALANAAFPS